MREQLCTGRVRFLLQALFLLAAVMPAWIPALAAAPGVHASLNTDSFRTDQAVLLTATVSGNNASRPELPQVNGLRFIYRGQSNQMQWINGRSSSNISFLYMVQADKPGSYTIPPITVRVDGKILKSNPLICTVLPAASQAAPPATGSAGHGSSGSTRLRSGEADRIGFMRITPKKSTAYSGERIPFTIRAYFRQGIRVTVKSQPRVIGDSFVLEDLGKQPQQTEEIVDGTPYTVLTWHGSLSGIKAGIFPLEVEIDTSLLVRQARRHPSSMFGNPFLDDPFFDDFFGNLARKDIKLVSPRQSMTIRDWPTKDRPADFNGAIGTFSLAVTADPTNGKVGDPITLKMQVTGTGNFDRVQAPVFTGGQQWKIYPPSEEFVDRGNGKGKKTFTRAIVPASSAIHEVPPVTFSYFDPEAGEYTTLQSDPIALHLKQSSSPRQSTASGARQTENQATDATMQPPPSPASALVPLYTEPGTLYPAILPVYQRVWFMALFAFSCIMLLSALALRSRRRRLLADPGLLQRKEVDRKLAHLFLDMEQAIATGDAGAFLDKCSLAIQEKAGLAWQREPRSITLADLQQHLAANSALLRVFEMSEHAKYAGTRPGINEMNDLFERIKKELDNLS